MAGSTPSDRWQAQRADLKKRCQKVAGLSKKIRYVCVINQYGRTLAGTVRPGIKPLLSAENARNEFFLASGLLGMRESTARPLGRLDYVTMRHEKVIIVLLRRNGLVYYVSIDAGVRDIAKLVTRIKRSV